MNDKDLKSLIKRVLREQEKPSNYMFFSNLEQLIKQATSLLELDPQVVNEIIENGHDWADDHVSTAKENLDQVYDFLMGQIDDIDGDVIMSEGRKKTGTKLCSRGKSAAKAKFKVYPSAYANGYAVQVCKGRMPGLDGKKRCSGAYC